MAAVLVLHGRKGTEMNNKRMRLPVFFLVLLMAMGQMSLATFAADPDITNLSASYANNKVSVTGDAKEGILAVALAIYKGEDLVRMYTAGVSSETKEFSATIEGKLSPGEYTLKAMKYEGGTPVETTFTVTAPPASGGSGGSSGGGSGGSVEVPTTVVGQTAKADVSSQAAGLQSGKQVEVVIAPVKGVDSYSASLSAGLLKDNGNSALTLKTELADVSLPGNMLQNMNAQGDLEFTIGKGDKSGLPAEIRDAIGDRPLISLDLKIDGQAVEWNNPSTPVTVAMDYTPTAEELENPESLVIWYIDGAGNVHPLTNARYDAKKGQVILEVTHFSDYALVYNPVIFKDVAKDAWYYNAVSFIGAREVTKGTGDGNFSPQGKLTRGQFIVMLMKAYGIEAPDKPKDNFKDAGNTYYTAYLGEAKRLGLTAGVGNNNYAPERQINRQEMFTLLYNVLGELDRLPEKAGNRKLADFTDSQDVAPWAKDAMTLLVKADIIAGSGEKVNPLALTTRAEMGQLIYNLFTQ